MDGNRTYTSTERTRKRSWRRRFDTRSILLTMPQGTAKEFALDRGLDIGNVYKAIRKGKFEYPDAELYTETKTVIRVKWKQHKNKKVQA